MSDFWEVPSFEQVKAKKYRVRKNYNFAKLPYTMASLTARIRKDYEQMRSQMLGFTQGKHQASKRGYKHQHGKVFMPLKPEISPAEYRRQHKGKKDE